MITMHQQKGSILFREGMRHLKRPLHGLLPLLSAITCVFGVYAVPAATKGSWEGVESGTSQNIHAISIANDDFAAAVGSRNTVLIYDGRLWDLVSEARQAWSTDTTLRSVSALGKDNLWIGGNETTNRGRVLHWTGGEWQQAGSLGPWNQSMNAMWHSPSNAILVAGSSGRISRWDADRWTRRNNKGGVIRGIHGSSSNNVWAVAADNTILHSEDDGYSWEQHSALPMLPNGNNPRPQAVFTFADDATWIVGNRNWEVGFWNGKEFTLNQLRTSAGGLHAVHAVNRRNVWTVGDEGRVFHFDGNRWSEVFHGLTRERLNDVDSDRAGRIWIVGESGTILKYTPQRSEKHP